MEQNKKFNTMYLVMVALFTALTFVVTYFVNIPASIILGAGGNINLGDTIIFVAGIILGPVGGAIAGAFGAALADVASAYVVYAPFTFVIKGLSGFMVGFMFRYVFGAKQESFVAKLVSILVGAAIVVVGYFFAEAILMGIYGSDGMTALVKALVTIIPNCVQVGCSCAVSLIVMPKVFSIYLMSASGQNRAT